MSLSIKKAIVCCFCYVAALGFATGINFSDNFDVFESAKRCFEFGLYVFFEGKEHYKIFFSLLFSTLKYSLLMILGIFSWGTFIFVPIILFCVCFKFGVVCGFVLKILKFNNLLESLCVLLIVCVILASLLLFSISIFDRRIYHLRNKRIDNTDVIFLNRIICCILLFVALINCIYLVLSGMGIKLFGFFNTFL